MNIADGIREVARRVPAAPAVIHQGTKITYGALDGTIDAVAGRLLRAGLGPGSIVALAVGGNYQNLVTALALARIGAAAAPARLRSTRITARLAAAPPARVEDAPIVVDASWFVAPSPSPTAVVPGHSAGDATAVVFGSSGTTGEPKGIAVSHDCLVRRIEVAERGVPLPAAPRQICGVDALTGYGFLSMLRVLWAGGTLVLVRGYEEMGAAIARHAVNRLVLPPFAIERVVTSLAPDAGPLPSLAQVEVGGSNLPAPLSRLARARLCSSLHVVYGATEGGFVASGPAHALENIGGAVGYVLPGIDAEVVDADATSLPASTEGNLRVRGDTLVDAYFDDPAASALAFRDGWFHPGDTASLAGDGLLVVSGRRDDAINAGGVKVRPQVVEDALLLLPGVRDAAAFGAPDAFGLTEIWAAIVAGHDVDVAALDAHCRSRLGGLSPKFVMRVNEIPRNAAGKVLRGELVKLAARVGRRGPGP